MKISALATSVKTIGMVVTAKQEASQTVREKGLVRVNMVLFCYVRLDEFFLKEDFYTTNIFSPFE